MNKCIKLLSLIILSLSVYFIYLNTENKVLNILVIGDNYSQGINSYGIKEYSYIDYTLEELETNKEIKLKKYITKDQSITNTLNYIKLTSDIKGYLKDAHILILNIGYNDLIYKLSIKEYNQTNNNIYNEISNDYNNLLQEIRKYYKREIIVIGYPLYKDTSINTSIIKLNNILNNDNISYIDTNKILSNREKYFSNPHNNYPNRNGYLELSKEIIRKTLEKQENI